MDFMKKVRGYEQLATCPRSHFLFFFVQRAKAMKAAASEGMQKLKEKVPSVNSHILFQAFCEDEPSMDY